MESSRERLEAIEQGERRRPINQGRVDHLVASIKEIGLQTPITLMRKPDGDDWLLFLVAGAHRLEAFRQMGREWIDCFILPHDDDIAELWEIDENFARAELTVAQRADHHVRREAILVRRGEAFTKGGDRKSNAQPEHLISYPAKAAADLGMSEGAVRRDLGRGKRIDPEVLGRITGTDLDKGVVLDELAATPKEDQRAKLAEIQERRSIVRPAPDPLNDPEAHEKQLSALMAAWNRSAAVVREEFLLRVGAA